MPLLEICHMCPQSTTWLGYFIYNQGNSLINISSWDVSQVTSMSSIVWGIELKSPCLMCFVMRGLSISPFPLNVSQVTSMNSMFFQALTFNQDLSGWNVLGITGRWRGAGTCALAVRVPSAWWVAVLSLGLAYHDPRYHHQQVPGPGGLHAQEWFWKVYACVEVWVSREVIPCAPLWDTELRELLRLAATIDSKGKSSILPL